MLPREGGSPTPYPPTQGGGCGGNMPLSVSFKTGGRVTGSFLTALPTVMVARLPALGPGDQCVPSTAPHR